MIPEVTRFHTSWGWWQNLVHQEVARDLFLYPEELTHVFFCKTSITILVFKSTGRAASAQMTGEFGTWCRWFLCCIPFFVLALQWRELHFHPAFFDRFSNPIPKRHLIMFNFPPPFPAVDASDMSGVHDLHETYHPATKINKNGSVLVESSISTGPCCIS